jgi:hypothetical protein
LDAKRAGFPLARLRLHDHQTLFEIEGNKVVVYRGGRRGINVSERPTYEEFTAIEQALTDAEDLAALRAAKQEEHGAPGVSLEQVIDDLGLSS